MRPSSTWLSIIAAGLISSTLHADSTSEKVMAIQLSRIPVVETLDATLEAVYQSTISAQTSGVIKAIYADVNDQVAKGALLVEILDTQQQAEVAQAKASLAQAEAINEDAQTLLRRNTRLQKQGTLSEGEYDRTVAQAKSTAATVQAAKAMLDQAQEQLSYTRVIAPYSGIVSARHIELGELVDPGQALMTGLAQGELRAVTDVPQRVALRYNAKTNKQVTVFVSGIAVTPSKVTLYPVADSRHHSIRMRAELPPQTELNAFPGMWASVQINTGERDAILIPNSALLNRSELNAVYVKNAKGIHLRQVRVGNTYNNQVEILSGLQVGDSVMIDALAQLATPNLSSHEPKGE
jgi:RND family efflux transporter MFP subunit